MLQRLWISPKFSNKLGKYKAFLCIKLFEKFELQIKNLKALTWEFVTFVRIKNASQTGFLTS